MNFERKVLKTPIALDKSSDNISIYAGSLNDVFLDFLKSYLQVTSGKILVFVKPVENYPYQASSNVKKFLSQLYKKNHPVMFVETTPVEHYIASSLYPEFEHIMLSVFDVEKIILRDILPKDGAIVVKLDRCRILEELINELNKIGFTPLMININIPVNACFHPLIINALAENPLSVMEKSIMGIVGAHDALSNIVFHSMISDSRPVIVCGNPTRNTRYDETGLVFKINNCDPLELANAVVSVYNNLELFRKRGTRRFEDVFYEKSVERVKQFIS
ncbi:MAG: hypothetical protein QXU53_03510 [Thermosphaera sp.]